MPQLLRGHEGMEACMREREELNREQDHLVGAGPVHQRRCRIHKARQQGAHRRNQSTNGDLGFGGDGEHLRVLVESVLQVRDSLHDASQRGRGHPASKRVEAWQERRPELDEDM